jgi:hypothetical protein
MAMKKTFGGNSPLWQGAGKSFWTLPISGRWWRRIVMYSGKVIGFLGFSRRGVFIGEGAALEVDMGGLTTRGTGQGQAAPPCGVALWKLRQISGCSAFVLSNFENISCVTFLKHKNSRK